MASTHMPPPCSWSTNLHRALAESCDAVLLGGEVRWALKPRRLSVARRAGRSGRRAAGICCARFAFQRGEAKEEDAATVMEIVTLVEGLFKLNEAVNEANKGIGPDVRTRVDALYNRATLLKSSADSLLASGGRVPVHLTATLRSLQREHASVENIVRLATEAGPVIIGVEESKRSFVEATKVVTKDEEETLSVVFKEKEETDGSLFNSLARQSSFESVAVSGIEEYLMTTPVSRDASSLSAFRREIERRVMEQLAEKNKPRMDSGVAIKEQEERRNAATSETSNVLGQIQNLPLRGRLPRRREMGAVNDEAQPADSTLYLGEPAAQPLDQRSGESLTETQQHPSTSMVETEKELEELRSALSVLEPQLSVAKEYSARAERAETKLQQLTEEMAATVPLDIHNQVVKVQRESLVRARTKIAQVTADLKEKEVIIGAIKQESTAERESLLEKVRELSSELSKRVNAEEVEAAVNNAVHELETELGKALKRSESMKLELETSETLLKQVQQEWDAERTNLRGELAHVKEHLAELQQEQAGDRTKFLETVEKVKELEGSVSRMQQSMVEADEEWINKAKNVRLLVTDMVKTKRLQAKVDSRLLEATKELHGNELQANQTNSAEDLLESILSEERAVALETFFTMMGVLIQKESGNLGTTSHRSRELDNGPRSRELKNDHLEQDLGNMGSVKVDVEMVTKPIITLYYESSWEFAYLHYSADNLGWTDLPGVCMRNDIVVNNVPLKVIDVEGSSIEFVLTDGRGSWDCAPLGGNYHIRNSGTFLLSSGCVEEKKRGIHFL